MRPLKIYICGPISGMKNQNKKAFQEAESHIVDRGHIAYNPHKFEEHYSRVNDKWEGFMKRDIPYLCKSDLVVTLPGIEDSRGAKLEILLSSTLDIPVTTLSNFMDTGETEVATMLVKGAHKGSVTLGGIIYAVSMVTGIGAELINSSKRNVPIVNARKAYYYIAVRVAGYTYAKTGRYIERDHSTVMHGVQQCQDLIDVDDNIKDTVQKAIDFLGINR